MIRKRVQNEADPENPPGLGSVAAEAAAGATGEGEPSGLSTGRRAGPETDRLCQLLPTPRNGGLTSVWEVSTPGLWPMLCSNMPVTPVKSPLFSRPQFPFQLNEGVGETAKRPSS